MGVWAKQRGRRSVRRPIRPYAHTPIRPYAHTPIRPLVRYNHRLDRRPILHRRQRLVRLVERKTRRHHLAPRLLVAVARRQRHRAMEMIVARTPAALYLDVLAVQLPVRVDVDRSVVGILAAHHHAAAVAYEIERL